MRVTKKEEWANWLCKAIGVNIKKNKHTLLEIYNMYPEYQSGLALDGFDTQGNLSKIDTCCRNM